MREWIGAIVVAAIRAVAAVVLAIIRKKQREPGPIDPDQDPEHAPDLAGGDEVKPYDDQLREMISAVAADVGTDPGWLSKLIAFESGWDPQAANPDSSASGLIQFTDATARSLGYESSADLVQRNPDALSQLDGPVRRYLLQYAPLDTDQKLFMAVFYPEAMEWPLDREFPQWVQDANQAAGIKTVRDYMNHVWRRPDPWAITLIVLGIGGVALFTLLNR